MTHWPQLLERASQVANPDDKARIAAAIVLRDANYTEFIKTFKGLFDVYRNDIPHVKVGLVSGFQNKRLSKLSKIRVSKIGDFNT